MDIDPTKIFIEVITEISNYDVENENKQEAEMNNNNQINVKKRLTNKEKIKLTQEKLIEERNYQMQSMTCLAQNIISNRKKINFSNPKEVIEHLENEFRSLNLIKKSDETILTTRNLNLDKKKHDILNFQKRKKIQDEYKSDIIIQDIDQIKKKSKLLEFIILQKARNSYLLSIEAERYLEKEKLT